MPASLQQLLEAIPVAASSGRALFAYVVAVAAWVTLTLVIVREKNRLAAIEKIPSEDRLIYLGNPRIKGDMSPQQWLKSQIHRYFFIVILVFFLLVAFVVTLAMNNTPSIQPSDIADEIQRRSRPSMSEDIIEWGGLERANKAYEDGHREQALTLINDVISKIEQGKGQTIPGVREKSYLVRAMIRLDLRQYDDAVRDCNGVSRDVSNDPKLRWLMDDLRARAFIQLKRYAEAANDAWDIIRLMPGDAGGYETLALADLLSKEYENAVTAATQGLGIDSNNVGLLKTRYAAYYALNNSDGAAADKQRLSALGAFALAK